MAPIMPPSALALSTLPGSGLPSLPESSGPRATPQGLNLLALLQSTGNAPMPAISPILAVVALSAACLWCQPMGAPHAQVEMHWCGTNLRADPILALTEVCQQACVPKKSEGASTDVPAGQH